MFTIKLSTDRSGQVCWLARIIGTDDRYGLDREFLEATWAEHAHFTQRAVNFAYELDCGLYEACENGERRFFVVRQNSLNEFVMDDWIPRERVKVMAEMMSADTSDN